MVSFGCFSLGQSVGQVVRAWPLPVWMNKETDPNPIYAGMMENPERILCISIHPIDRALLLERLDFRYIYPCCKPGLLALI
jgi:hypothetical protein